MRSLYISEKDRSKLGKCLNQLSEEKETKAVLFLVANADYQPISGDLMKQWQNPENSTSPASLAADVIYTAITDDSDHLG